jgi:hypothetical protein
MNASEFLKYIIAFFGGSGLILFILFLFPEKVEKWSVMLWKIIYFLFKKGEKKIVAHDIQGRVNEFCKSLKKEIANFEPVGISIQWVTEKEKQSDFFKENRLIIRMRQHADQNKNFVYASMVFISKALLTKTKKYLSQTQRESIDLFVGRKLFEKERPQIIDRFFEDYFSPVALSSNKIMELLEKYEIIDKVGIFFPVLVQELTFLGEKVFYKPRDEKIITEVTSFINFLQKYAEREVGDETTPQNFEGAYCRCGIVIIAKSSKRERGDLNPFIGYIQKLVEKKLENIYLIGSASKDNRNFIDQISEEIQRKFRFESYTSKEYKAKIKIKGERKEVNNYLILHRSPEPLRYYDKEYQEKFVESEK